MYQYWNVLAVLKLLVGGEGCKAQGLPHTTYRRPSHYNSSTCVIPPPPKRIGIDKYPFSMPILYGNTLYFLDTDIYSYRCVYA